MDGGIVGDVVVVGRAEIDTRAPFRSVQEAVLLFGEKVLAGELYAGRRITDQTRAAATRPAVHHQPAAGAVDAVAAAMPRHVPVTRELDDAKHELEKEREEKQKMAGCIHSLQEELNNAMRELKKLKARDEEAAPRARIIDLQVEDLKFVEIDEQHHQHHQSPPRSNNAAAAAAAEFQKKRYVTFADPPAAAYNRAPSPPRLPDVVMELHHHQHQQQQYAPAGRPQYREVRFQRQVSAGHEAVKKAAAAAAEAEEGRRRKKKKPLIPMVGALFMRKKKSSSSSSHHDDAAIKPRPLF